MTASKATSSSKKSVQAILRTLVEVTNKLESEADRAAMLEVLGRLEAGGGGKQQPQHPPIIMENHGGDGSGSSSRSSESSSCYDRRIDNAIKRGETAADDDDDDTDSSDGSSHSSRVETTTTTSTSAFSRWENRGISVQGILALFGLSNLLWSEDTESKTEDPEWATSDDGGKKGVRNAGNTGCVGAVCVGDTASEVPPVKSIPAPRSRSPSIIRKPVVDEDMVDDGERMFRERDDVLSLGSVESSQFGTPDAPGMVM